MIPGVQYCHTDSLTLGLCYITIMELAVHQFLPLGREVPTVLPFAPPLENNHTGGSSLLAPPWWYQRAHYYLVVYYYYTTIRGPAQGGLTTRHYRAQHGITWQGHDRSKQVISSLLLHLTYLPEVSYSSAPRIKVEKTLKKNQLASVLNHRKAYCQSQIEIPGGL